jgi:hypothetical protein
MLSKASYTDSLQVAAHFAWRASVAMGPLFTNIAIKIWREYIAT